MFVPTVAIWVEQPLFAEIASGSDSPLPELYKGCGTRTREPHFLKTITFELL